MLTKNEGKKIFLVYLFLVVGMCMYAQSSGNLSIPSLKNGLSIILGFFSSGYMRAILSIALGGLAIGLISNRGEPGVMKKFVPWIATCVILLSLSAITGVLFNGVNEITTQQTWN